jgi:hypothetical protein
MEQKEFSMKNGQLHCMRTINISVTLKVLKPVSLWSSAGEDFNAMKRQNKIFPTFKRLIPQDL